MNNILQAQIDAILESMDPDQPDVEPALEAWLEHAPAPWRSALVRVAGHELSLAVDRITDGEPARDAVLRALLAISAQRS